MSKLLAIFFLLFGFTSFVSAQETQNDSLEINQELEGDFSQDSLKIKDISIYRLPKNMTEEDWKLYRFLEKRVYDVWPFVKLTVENYNNIENDLSALEKNSAKRKLIRSRQQQLAEEWEQKLRDMSRSRGRILIKLIQRETEMTAYDMLKKLKGGFIAFGWQAQAGLFEQNLKDTFQPDNRKEDLFIQVILQNAFRSGRLIPIQIMLMDEAAAGY